MLLLLLLFKLPRCRFTLCVFVCVGVYQTHPHTQTHHVTPSPPARRLQSEEAFRAEPPAQQVQFQPSGRTSVPSVVQWLNGSDSSCSEAGQALVQQSGHGGRKGGRGRGRGRGMKRWRRKEERGWRGDEEMEEG